MEGDIEVHRHKETGQEVYTARTETPIEALYETAKKTIMQHMRTAGDPVMTGERAEAVREAVEKMEKVCEHPRADWTAWWLLAKGSFAIDRPEEAYDAFRAAYAIEQNKTVIPREWAGVCMELGRLDEAIDIARKAVSIEPDNPELIGNLSIAYLLACRIDEASRSIDAALKIDSSDTINHTLRRLITETQDGRRPQPRTFSDLSQPAKPRKKLWQFWK